MAEVAVPARANDTMEFVPEELDLEPGVPYESKRVRVLDFRLPAGDSAVVEHTLPTVRWEVTLRADVPTPTPLFFESGSTYQIENTCTEERREIVFEILGAPRMTEEEVRSLERAAIYTALVGTDCVLENSYCRMVELKLPPGGAGPPAGFHQHTLDYGMVWVQQTRQNVWQPASEPEQQQDTKFLLEAIFNDGHFMWKTVPRGGCDDKGSPHLGWAAHNVTNNRRDEWLRIFHIELK